MFYQVTSGREAPLTANTYTIATTLAMPRVYQLCNMGARLTVNFDGPMAFRMMKTWAANSEKSCDWRRSAPARLQGTHS
jgi:hypothetical protein